MSNIYFICGDEDFLVEQEVKSLKARLISGDRPSIEYFEGEFDLDELFAVASNLDMFASSKVIFIKNPEALAESSLDEEQLEKWGKILIETPGNVVLVIYTYIQPDKRSQLFKLICKKAQIQEFKQLNFWESDKLLAWITQYAKSQGKDLSRGAAQLMLEIVGPNMRAIASEVAKLATYAGTRGMINEEDVLSIVSEGQINIFKLREALESRELNASLLYLQKLLKNKEDPIKLLGFIASNFRRLLEVKALQQSRASQEQISDYFGKSPYMAKKYVVAANRFSIEELKSFLAGLADTDLKLKSGRPAQLTLEMLLMGICKSN